MYGTHRLFIFSIYLIEFDTKKFSCCNAYTVCTNMLMVLVLFHLILPNFFIEYVWFIHQYCSRLFYWCCTNRMISVANDSMCFIISLMVYNVHVTSMPQVFITENNMWSGNLYPLLFCVHDVRKNYSTPLIEAFTVQYIPRNMHTVFALLCFVVVIHWLIFPYPSGLLHWHCGNLTIAPVPTKQPWWIWINTSCEFIMKDCITTTKQSTTKPCAYSWDILYMYPS